MTKGKIAILVLLFFIVVLLLYLGPEKYLNLEFVKRKLETLTVFQETNPILAIGIFSAIYVAVTSASIPGALILTLTAGALFGFIAGSLIAVTSATLGATFAFWIARYLFGNTIRHKMGDRLLKINNSFEKEGALYLFSMRLVPIFPFFAINLLMGLTPIKTVTYMLASFIGMLPGTMVYVNAGTQLSKLDSMSGLLSPAMITSFVLLAVFPYCAKFLVQQIKKRTSS